MLKPPPPIQSDLVPLTPLGVGDFMPPFRMQDNEGIWREIQLFAGKPCIVCLLPSGADAFVTEFMALYRANAGRLGELDVRVIFHAPVAFSDVAAFKERHNIPQSVRADETLGLFNAFGIADKAHSQPLSCALDINQRIVGIYTDRNAVNHITDMLRVAEFLSAQAKKTFAPPPAFAPVVVVRDVFSPAERERFIAYWESGKKYAGTLGVDGKETVNTQGKRRTDVNINDAKLMTDIDTILAKRLFPELRKVFGLDVTYREGYKIGLYTAADAGYYNTHRDTGVPALAHRRVSVSMLLNEDFEGGELVTPEYGPLASFKAPAGGVLCFPSTILHGVTPVTKGQRFVMVSFLYGDAQEQWRSAYCAGTKHPYTSKESRVTCQQVYPGLGYSQDFYTRMGI